MLSYRSGPGRNIELFPGFLGEMVVNSDIYIQGETAAIADFFEPTSSLVLGDLLFDVGSSAFGGANVTFALAGSASLNVRQDSGFAQMEVQSIDTAPASGMVLLKNSAVQYVLSSTVDGEFEVALQGSASPAALLRVQTHGISVPEFRFAGGMQVLSNGAVVHGGVAALDTGMHLSGGAAINGGVKVNNMGLTVSHGTVQVVDGMQVADGTVVQNGSLLVQTGGITVDEGGLNISDGGLHVHQTFEIASAGWNVTGGMTASDNGVVIQSGGARVAQGGVVIRDVGLLIETGQLHVAADGMNVSGGLVLNDYGLNVAAGGASLHGSVNVGGGMTVVNGGMTSEGAMGVLSDGINITGGVVITDHGMNLDGRSLGYAASIYIHDGHIGINSDNGYNASMLKIQSQLELVAQPAHTNSGGLQLSVHGFSSATIAGDRGRRNLPVVCGERRPGGGTGASHGSVDRIGQWHRSAGDVPISGRPTDSCWRFMGSVDIHCASNAATKCSRVADLPDHGEWFTVSCVQCNVRIRYSSFQWSTYRNAQLFGFRRAR